MWAQSRQPSGADRNTSVWGTDRKDHRKRKKHGSGYLRRNIKKNRMVITKMPETQRLRLHYPEITLAQ